MAALALGPSLSASAAAPFSTFDTAGPGARPIALLWWIMAGGTLLITAAMIALALYCAYRPARTEAIGERNWLLGGGVVFPSLVLLALVAGGTYATHLMAQRMAGTPFPVEVHARQWYWEVRYPENGAPSARSINVIHIPASVPVEIRLSTEDVIHSFWIPRLGGKVDAIPGRTHLVRLQADRPGVYRGLCAEFCGAGHAQMMLEVHAHDPDQLPAVLAALDRYGPSRPAADRSARP